MGSAGLHFLQSQTASPYFPATAEGKEVPRSHTSYKTLKDEKQPQPRLRTGHVPDANRPVQSHD